MTRGVAAISRTSQASYLKLLDTGRMVGGQGFLKGVVMDFPSFPKCQKCDDGDLIPLSDYGQEGASVLFKAWVCTNPDCGFSLRVDKGEVTYGKKIESKH